jgi:hypothetical protein
MITKDKFIHAGVNAACVLAITIIASIFHWQLYGLLAGVGLAIGASLGKEYGDSQASGKCWSWLDIIADAIGIIIGTGISLLIVLL